MSSTDLGDREFLGNPKKKEDKRDCIHCGHAMGEKSNEEPLCSHCGNKKSEISETVSQGGYECLREYVENLPREVNSAEEADIKAAEKYSGDIDTPKMSDNQEPTVCTHIYGKGSYIVNGLPQLSDEDIPPMPECKPPIDEEKGKKPESIKEHQPNAWKTYTIQELGNWVHLFLKRAKHRRDKAKARQDAMDAQNYLNMMQSEVDAVRKEVS